MKLTDRPEALKNVGGARVNAARESAGTGITRRIPVEVPVFLAYAALSAFLTWPVLKDITHKVYGIPSDNLGAMWTWWWIKNAGAFGASPSFSPLIGYPFGQPIAVVTSEFILDLAVRFLMLFTNQVVALNIIIYSSFVLSGITMYYLVKYIVGDRRVAFFGGLAYLLSAYHAFHAMLFPNLAMTQWMPLYVLVLLVFLKKPSPRNAVLLLLSAILVVGTCVHYGLFMAVFTPVFLIGRYAYKRLRAGRLRRAGEERGMEPVRVNRNTLVLALLVILAVVVVVLPLFLVGNSQSSRDVNWPTRSTTGSLRTIEMDHAGSAAPWAYLLPEKENRFMGWFSRKLFPSETTGWDNSLYLGLTIMALAVLAVLLAVLPRGKRDAAAGGEELRAPPGEGRHGLRGSMPVETRATVWGLVAAGVVAFIFSMPPYFNIGSRRIPLPSILMHYTVPWLRWYMRYGAVVILCAVLLACIGLWRLLARISGAWSILLVGVLSVLLFLEMTLVPPFKYFTVRDEPPGVFTRITSVEGVKGLVIYPAFEPGFFSSQLYQFYQTSFQEPMLNGGMENSDGEAMRRTIYNPFNPATPSILSRLDITHVMYLDRMFEDYEGTDKAAREVTHLPPGLELVERVADDDLFGSGYIYRVTAQPADLAPIYRGDITTPHMDEGRVTVRLMEKAGIITLVNYTGRDVRTSLRIPISNINATHDIALLDIESVLWKGKLSGDESDVIEIPDLEVPEEGLELGISVTGPDLPIIGRESEVFGTRAATIKLGDVVLGPARP